MISSVKTSRSDLPNIFKIVNATKKEELLNKKVNVVAYTGEFCSFSKRVKSWSWSSSIWCKCSIFCKSK